MAGRGSRFKDLSPDTPKPLVPLHDQPLVRWVVQNLTFEKNQKFIFVCLKEHVEQFRLKKLFASWDINFEIVIAPDVTEGAACSALLAESLITKDELIIANSDQFLIYNKSQFLEQARQHDGFIMSMNASGPKWSYIKTNDNNDVTLVKEKDPISDIGTVGVYYFKNGSHFVQAAKEMILANDRHNHEFYLAPTYNYLIKSHPKVGHYNIGNVGTEMIGLGTSEDFRAFENNPLSATLAQELFK